MKQVIRLCQNIGKKQFIRATYEKVQIMSYYCEETCELNIKPFFCWLSGVRCKVFWNNYGDYILTYMDSD